MLQRRTWALAPREDRKGCSAIEELQALHVLLSACIDLLLRRQPILLPLLPIDHHRRHARAEPSRAPLRPARSCIVEIPPQHGHLAPLRLMVPAPRAPSLRGSSERPIRGRVPRRFRSARGVIASSTRLSPRLQSQRVFRRGISARQSPHSAVRAHRYATAGLATQRGLRGSSRYKRVELRVEWFSDRDASLLVRYQELRRTRFEPPRRR